MSFHKHFGKDPCTRTHALAINASRLAINARTLTSSHVRAFTTRARVCGHGSSPKFL